jgi:SHS2 domain-containing protein
MIMFMKKFEFLEHTADIKFQAFGESAEEVFSNSAGAMTTAMSDDKIEEKIFHKIKVKAEDYEGLLYRFLEELLVLFDGENFIMAKVKKIKIEGMELEAEVVGDDAKGYEIHEHIKAITYSEMFVKKQKNKWTAQVVLDV